ncbi:hypothetical protein LTR95_013474, partial [Oleoguttula sp. CCFEE 5521]
MNGHCTKPDVGNFHDMNAGVLEANLRDWHFTSPNEVPQYASNGSQQHTPDLLQTLNDQYTPSSKDADWFEVAGSGLDLETFDICSAYASSFSGDLDTTSPLESHYSACLLMDQPNHPEPGLASGSSRRPSVAPIPTQRMAQRPSAGIDASRVEATHQAETQLQYASLQSPSRKEIASKRTVPGPQEVLGMSHELPSWSTNVTPLTSHTACPSLVESLVVNEVVYEVVHPPLHRINPYSTPRARISDDHRVRNKLPPIIALALMVFTGSGKSTSSTQLTDKVGTKARQPGILSTSREVFGVHRPAHEPRLHSFVGDAQVSALLDHGASANFMSVGFAKRAGLRINPVASNVLKLPTGTEAALVGTVTAPLSIAGDTKSHLLRFQVLANSITDVILGHRFLKVSRAFARYRDHIIHTVREASRRCLRRVCLTTGAVQRVRGHINAEYTDAVADTGSDVTLLSKAYAKRRNLRVSYHWDDQVELEFADGSTAWTQGYVKNIDWTYSGSDPSGCQIDAYVLDSLPCEVLLGYEVLYHTEAFTLHEDALFSEYDDELDIGYGVEHSLSCIRRLSTPDTAPTQEEAWLAEKQLVFGRYDKAMTEAQSLPDADRPAFLAPFFADCEAVLQSRPPPLSASGNEP